MRSTFLSLVLISLPALVGAATISIDNFTASPRFNDNPGTISDFVVDGSNAHRFLVVGIVGEYASLPSNVTYGADDLTELTNASIIQPSGSMASIWVLDNPAGGMGDLVVTPGSGGTANGYHFGVMSLYSTGALSVSDSNELGGTSGSIGTLTLSAGVNDFVFVAAESNSTAAITTTDLTNNLFASNGSSFGGWAGSGDYGTGVTSIDYSGALGNPARYALAGVAITAVPETSSLLISMLGACLLLRRRRGVAES